MSDGYELSDAEKRDLIKLITEGKPLPDKYRFVLFQDKREVELVWNGKTREVSTAVLPFQSLEHIDEPREEKGEREAAGLFDLRGRQLRGWTNKLVWGDNKLILSSLKSGALRQQIEEAGGLRLIYIDPPFDVGADFSMDIEIGGETFHKEPNLLEQIAYRDTWGRGADSFIAMLYERLVLMRDLLHPDGSIYVHMGWGVSHYVRSVLDEVFGREYAVNQIIWKRQTAHSDSGQGSEHLGRLHDVIFLYSKGRSYSWNLQYVPYDEKYLQTHYKNTEPQTSRRYELDNLTAPGGSAKGNPNYEFLGVSRFWRYSRERMQSLYEEGRIVQPSPGAVPRFKRYLDEMPGVPVQDIWDDLNAINSQAKEATGYNTQKPEALLERIISLSSNEGDLVADFFCGSGTTAAVAEKLGRKWIVSDLGKFAVHTTRKRLIQVQRERKAKDKTFRAFEVLNLGRYERQVYLNVSSRLTGRKREQALARKEQEFRDLILKAYRAEPLPESGFFHGKTGARLVVVGPINLPVGRLFVEEVITECRKRGATRVDILAFEFEMGLFPAVLDEAKRKGIDLTPKTIPPEVFDKRAVDRGQVRFQDVAYIEVTPRFDAKSPLSLAVELTDFSVFYSQGLAHRVRSFLRTSPVLLLTATPMQNSLAELWGLVQYVEPTGTLLGDITTFREVFCADDDRTLVPGQEHELQRRLGSVLQRTLRRQAQEFLDRPFTQRRCRLYEYEMSSDERSLYDDVTQYLLQPSLYAFAGSQRRLLLIGFHRRMASSIPALAASLENVAARLRRLKAGQRATLSTDDLRDLEDEEDAEVEAEEQAAPPDTGAVAEELSLVEDFVARARSLPHDAKARSFQEAIRVVLERGRDGTGSGKAVVFTESITTQEYLRRLLLDMGLGDEDVTLFRGTNDHERAKQAHARWLQEEGRNLPPGTRPTREVAVRLALVHEFRTRSKVLVCTEAGAKGLNLQFCETIINYDLPWNPQRIEQRIGRCHRYSQQRDVTVVNFIARDNEAHHLTFEILSQKLDLFGKVLDASDHVLHEPRTDAPETAVSAVSIEFENDLRRIYSRSRTLDEVTREIAALRDKIGAKREAFEKEYERTSQIIESRFDEDVRKVFKRLREELPAGLLQLDREISDLVEGHLRSHGIPYTRTQADGRVVFDVAEDADLPAEFGDVRRFATGDARGLTDAQPLNLLHPLVRVAIDEARRWAGGSVELVADATPELAALQGHTGVLAIALIDYAGFEPVQRIVAAAVVGEAPVDPSLASRIARLPAADGSDVGVTVDRGFMDDALDEAVFLDQREVEKKEQKHFEQAIGQLERFVDDKVLVCRRERASISEKLRSARDRRDEVVGSSARDRVEAEILRLAEKDEVLERRISALASREDEVYRKWRNEYHNLRYRAPKVTRLFQVAFRITAPRPMTSC